MKTVRFSNGTYAEAYRDEIRGHIDFYIHIPGDSHWNKYKGRGFWTAAALTAEREKSAQYARLYKG